MKHSHAQNTKPVLTWHKNSAVVHQVTLSPIYKKPYSCLWNAAIWGEREGNTSTCVSAEWWAAQMLPVNGKVEWNASQPGKNDKNDPMGTQQERGAGEERFWGCTHVRKVQRQGTPLLSGGERQGLQTGWEYLVYGRRQGQGVLGHHRQIKGWGSCKVWLCSPEGHPWSQRTGLHAGTEILWQLDCHGQEVNTILSPKCGVGCSRLCSLRQKHLHLRNTQMESRC